MVIIAVALGIFFFLQYSETKKPGESCFIVINYFNFSVHIFYNFFNLLYSQFFVFAPG